MRELPIKNLRKLRNPSAVNLIGRTLICFFLLCSTTSAYAVGLGKLRVLSALDQPLDAEIELLSTTPAELNTLQVGLGSRSDFTRAGVERSEFLSLVQFEPGVRDNGEVFVKLTTRDPVSEPFLHFLIALDWTGGKLIREYTALLDPPLYAQGRPASVSSPRLAGADPAGSAVRSAPSIAPPSASARVQDGQLYGPISRGETASEIVNRMNLPEGVDVFQAMIALLQRNPEAFILGNINLIKEGSTISLPSAEEMASISRVIASTEYSRQYNSWLAYRNRVTGAQLATTGTPDSTPTATPLPAPDTDVQAEPMQAPEMAETDVSSGLSDDVLRIIQSGESGQTGDTISGDGEEVGVLRSQLAVMEESLLSAELENRQLRERLAGLEEQIRETNRLLRLNNPGLALAEQAASGAEVPVPTSDPVPASESTPASDPVVRTTVEPEQPATSGAEQVRVTNSSSLLDPINELLRGEALWKLLLALAAIVLLIGIIVYIRRRQSYAEFEETMMTGSTYDLRSQSSAFTQVPRMDSLQQSRQSTRADSQQSGSLMQTSFMTEMGAPGMGAMQADEVDPVAEAEVYMAYGRDQQAMEVLQDAIRRDPSRLELKIKLLEVYQKRKDVRAFEGLAEELYPAIGKDAARWSRVTEMGRRISPRHPLFAAAAGGSSLGMESTQASGRARSGVDRDSSGLDLISAPFTRGAPYASSAVDERGIDLPSNGNRAAGDGAASLQTSGLGAEFDLDADSVSLPYAGGLNTPSTPASAADDSMGKFDAVLGGGAQPMDDFKASEIATKLDLAKAYLEMGDKDAARGFIEEVLKDGNEDQRQRASELASSF
jgi:pilus assembly protein FimV